MFTKQVKLFYFPNCFQYRNKNGEKRFLTDLFFDDYRVVERGGMNRCLHTASLPGIVS